MKVYQEPAVEVYQGHALTELQVMPAESVDMVMTSPPYYGLRSYRTEPIVWGNHNECEHEWQAETFKQHAGRGDCQQSKKYSEQAPVPDMVLKRDFCLKCNAWKGELGLEPHMDCGRPLMKLRDDLSEKEREYVMTEIKKEGLV